MAAKTLPLYKLRINPARKSFVKVISLVGEPAIESNLLFFSKQDDVVMNTFSADEERKETISAAMIPDIKIFRRNKKTGEEFNVMFEKEDIRKIAQHFMASGFQNNLNINHQDENAGMSIWQSYIVDTAMGITAPKGLDVPDGTWIIGAKVHDKSTWNRIKSGELKGFSVEGVFESILSIDEFKKNTSVDDEIMELLNKINLKIK